MTGRDDEEGVAHVCSGDRRGGEAAGGGCGRPLLSPAGARRRRAFLSPFSPRRPVHRKSLHQGGPMSGIGRKILVPIDGSEGSLHAVRFAGELASSIGGHLLLLHVHDAPTPELMGMTSLESDDVRSRLGKLAAPKFAAAHEALGHLDQKLDVVELVRLGNASDEIIEAARHYEVDQIVMGSRGLGPIDTLLLGSVSEKVVRRAPCPVTIVR
ncbi:MAG: universal stress protein [Deltaproteobacteria bacterium]|nr:MAG: universal stress protein [Deltaproteobacteria bacterium]